jgi:hypothetical protein
MDNLKAHEKYLCKVVSTRHKKNIKLLIKESKPSQLNAICEIILNTIKGVIPIPKALHKKITKYKIVFRDLVLKCLKRALRKKLLIKYYNIVRTLLAAVLPICGIIGEVLVSA